MPQVRKSKGSPKDAKGKGTGGQFASKPVASQPRTPGLTLDTRLTQVVYTNPKKKSHESFPPAMFRERYLAEHENRRPIFLWKVVRRKHNAHVSREADALAPEFNAYLHESRDRARVNLSPSYRQFAVRQNTPQDRQFVKSNIDAFMREKKALKGTSP